MYIPLNTSTLAAVWATVIAKGPTSVSSESVLPLGPGVGSGPSGPDTIDNVAMPLSTRPFPPAAGRFDGPFPDFPDQDYMRLGEDPLVGCIRDAVNNAGHERYTELTSNNEWEDFLINSRDRGLVGVDTNQDGNDVDGLVDWVHGIAKYDNPDLDPELDDPETCAGLVKRFTSHGLLDEVIISWASLTGIIRDLPPTRPPGPPGPVAKRDTVYDVVLEDGHRSKLKLIDGVIGYIPKDNDTSDPSTRPVWIPVDGGAIVYTPGKKYEWPNVTDHAKPKAPYNNSTLHARSNHPDALRLSPVPDNSTGLESRLCTGILSPGVGPVFWNLTIPSNFTFPWNLTIARNSTDHVKTLLCKRLASLGNATVHRSLNSTRRVLMIDDYNPGLYNSSTMSHNSSSASHKSIHEPTPAIPEEV